MLQLPLNNAVLTQKMFLKLFPIKLSLFFCSFKTLTQLSFLLGCLVLCIIVAFVGITLFIAYIVAHSGLIADGNQRLFYLLVDC